MCVSINKLSDIAIKNLKPGKHFDGGGLFLLVSDALPPTKLWRFKYRFAGREKLLSIGKYPEVSLREARQARDEAKRQIREGLDPSSEKVAKKNRMKAEANLSVCKCAVTWFEKMAPSWGEGTRFATHSSFRRDVFPLLGGKPLAELTTLDVLSAVKRVEQRGAGDQAKRLLMRLSAFLRWAVVNQIIQTNPANNLKPSEVLKTRFVKHREALKKDELPEFLARLRCYSGDIVTAIGVSVLIHTAMRPGEVRGLRWTEIDFENLLISIPAERMKMRRPFRVPLTPQVLSAIERLKPLNGHRTFVFASPSSPEKTISENTLNLAIKRLGYTATSHGMRSTFSTIANESQNFSADVIEAALAHQDKNRVRAVYARTDYFEQRVHLMRWWSNYLDALHNMDEVAQKKLA
jgi:integrase